MSDVPQMIGLGVYHLSEAAKYTGVPTATLRSWFKVRSDGQGVGPIFDSDFDPVDDDFAISFLNLMEAYVARFFKKEGVGPATIRRAREILRDELHTGHPFAHADLRTDGIRIIQKIKNRDLIDVISKQHFFGQMNLGRVKYSEATRLAEVWWIARGIVIDPQINYGKPVIENSGVSTLVVARQYHANRKNAALVAKLFKVTKIGVTQAYRFEKRLGRVAA